MPIETAVRRLERRRTKIVATLGPVSSDPATVEALIRAGAGVFRLNFSHGTHEDHERSYRTVREVAAHVGEPVGILGDLCGPKIRAGRFQGGGVELVRDPRVAERGRRSGPAPGAVRRSVSYRPVDGGRALPTTTTAPPFSLARVMARSA